MNAAIWLLILPLFSAFSLPIAHRHWPKYTPWLVGVVLALCLLMTAGLWQSVLLHGPQTLNLGGFPAPLGIVFYIDWLALVLVFALLSLTLILLWGYGQERIREYTLLMLSVAGGCGMAMSGDLFNIYVFYEMVAVASYGLTAARGTGAAYAASLRYLLLGALGSALALLGIAMIYAQASTLNLAHLAALGPQILHTPQGVIGGMLLVIGFGVKAELFPVNTWVPEVYVTAESRISAFLAGIVSKLSLLIILRLLLLIYTDTPVAHLLFLLGVLGVLTGELAALRAPTMQQMLAFSSIGQLGLLAMAFALPGQIGVAAGVALLVHHLIVKSALFLLADNWRGSLDSLRGAGWRAPLVGAVFVLFALSLIGVPPLPGFWAKFLLVKAVLVAGGWYAWGLVFILGASLLETVYLMRVARNLYQRVPDSQPVALPTQRDLRPVWALSIALLLGVFMIAPLSKGLSHISYRPLDAKAYIQHSQPAFKDAWRTSH